jgi:sensor domain CHASE-containing protein
MSGVDKSLAEQNERKAEREAKEQHRKDKASKMQKVDETVVLASSSSSSSSTASGEYTPAKHLVRKKPQPNPDVPEPSPQHPLFVRGDSKTS